MNIPCNIPCQTCTPFIPGTGSSPADPDYPFINLSSESPDSDPYIGRRFGPPPGDPGGGPPLGNLFYAIGCLGFCVSTISQEDADLCAQRQEMDCLGVNWPQPPVSPPTVPLGPFLPPGLPPTALFGNSPQSCDFSCPDGQRFTYTVAAGTFTSFSQAAADVAAYTYACKKAAELRLCMGSLSPAIHCAGSEYTGSISVSSGLLPIMFSIVGDLPDGLLQTQSVDSTTLFLSGIVSVPGDYTFTVVATDREGHSMQKACALTFFGIVTDSSLPDATEDEAYSVSLVTGGTVIETVTFTLSGALPDGLTFNTATGTISGTPDPGTNGEYNFTITAHADGMSCPKEFFLLVEESSDCPDWDTLLWGVPVVYANGLAASSFDPDSIAQSSYDAQCSCTGPNPLFNAGAQNNATLTYNGSGCDCVANLNITVTGGAGAVLVASSISGILLLVDTSLGSGAHSIPFSIPDTGGMDDTITIGVQVDINGTDDGVCNISGNFENA